VKNFMNDYEWMILNILRCRYQKVFIYDIRFALKKLTK
jgi:hypothetical protein